MRNPSQSISPYDMCQAQTPPWRFGTGAFCSFGALYGDRHASPLTRSSDATRLGESYPKSASLMVPFDDASCPGDVLGTHPSLQSLAIVNSGDLR